MRHKLLFLLVNFFVLFTLSFMSNPAVAATSKITITPNPVTLQVYQSYVAEFKLTQPIICPQLPNGVVCKVVLNLNTSGDSRIQLDKTSITWLSNQWAESRYVTTTYIPDNVYNNGNDSIKLHGVSGAYSGSDPDVVPITTAPYYYTLDAEATINAIDIDSPTTTTSTTAKLPAPTISSPSASAPGKTITVSGSNFKADSDVTVELHSTPVTLGTFRTNASGAFTAQVKIPKNATLGSHQIVVNGTNVAGTSVSQAANFTVGGLANTGGNSRTNSAFALIIIALGYVLIKSAKNFRVAK